MKKTIEKYILLVSLLSIAHCGIWVEVEPKQFVHPFTHSDVKGWTATPPHPNLVTTCNGQNIVGGYGLFSQGQKLEKQYLGLQYFEQIKIQLTLYQIDSWDQSHQHGFDEFQIKIDGNLVQSVIKSSGPDGGTPLCGGGWKDEVVQVSYQGNHSGTSFLLTFFDTLNQGSKDESWGIQNLEIYIYLKCKPPLVQFGNLCLLEKELQYCHKLLGLLDSSPVKNTSIDNFCYPLVEQDQQVYELVVVYNKPFELDPKCLTQKVKVEGVFLKEGPGPYDEWQFDPVKQTTKFKLKHEDLVKKYGCQYLVTDFEFIWICDIHIKIYLGGELQLHYKFQFKIFLSRHYKNKLVVNVTKSIVIGDCCENKLKIKTELKFCVDFTCGAYLPSPLSIKRKQSFFVEHSIVSPEFKYYYLHGISVTLGAFIPTIVKHDGSQKGRLIYELQSNIALNGLILTVISQLAEVPSRLRRQLEEDQVGSEYKVKAENNGLTIEELDSDPFKKQEEKQQQNIGLIAAVACVGVISVLSIGGSVIYCLKVKKSNVAQKYSNKDSKCTDENIELATKIEVAQQ